MKESLELILLRVSQSADIDKGELDVASRLIINSVCEGLQITRAGIWLYDEMQTLVQCTLLIDKGNDLDHESLVLTRKDFPHYFEALDSERTIAAHDALTDVATFEFAEVYLTPLGISSMLDVPIRHRGKMIGIICCEHQGKAREWHADEVVFAASLADLYGRAVSANERADYEQRLIEANQTLEQKVIDRTAELEAAQEKLVESEKMAALGNLVAGIAHEVNTPLGIALTSVSNCKEELKGIYRDFENDELTEQGFKDFEAICSEGLNLAETSLMRAANLVQDFKRTSADQTSLEIEEIALDEYIPRVCNPLKPMLRKEQVELSIDVTPNLVITTCPGIIAQLLTNLISNAQRHAFGPSVNNDVNRVSVSCSKNAKGIVISVQDNGKGIPEALHKKVFEPFYTTARDKGGTGLGLNILYNLVRQKFNGEIDLTSTLGEGTKVTVCIPVED
ncbi:MULTISPECIES: sensor histidine kinase [Alteromonas]|jgi:two-component system NtrC family sensor kinase|uniref:sensor histidine kinase n=1 Tax=Alteromonas TaxID=226 RepID=UPI0012774338|nr:GAF domain-containing sensor histidine kinase [Alteromonas macleodii]MDM7963387.1 GAF domain-containing sensor histidine kinase [Alteromonas macleodii]MDM8171869.1 GAF domain-containing sensor histidine kinase [Alteromonas macleodii]CAI3962138.1 GAF sensor signal transduction histidine kinase [Alteromonas macleodii]VTP56031.1 GAF sensor signal transduction histidine kinase [Alteromonas macleodii]|tara:strand:+ start:74 stop:1426 length:1353 start_codon:yes stop_codon:yes gene_type:complete